MSVINIVSTAFGRLNGSEARFWTSMRSPSNPSRDVFSSLSFYSKKSFSSVKRPPASLLMAMQNRDRPRSSIKEFCYFDYSVQVMRQLWSHQGILAIFEGRMESLEAQHSEPTLDLSNMVASDNNFSLLGHDLSGRIGNKTSKLLRQFLKPRFLR